MDLATRFKQWMNRTTVRIPSQHDPAQYTAQVMERVRASSRPAVAAAPLVFWRSWSRVGLATALAAAAIFVWVVRPQRSSVQVAQQIDQQVAVLAESNSTDEEWLEQNLQILNEVDDGAPLEDLDASSQDDESLIEELQLLDKGDISTAS